MSWYDMRLWNNPKREGTNLRKFWGYNKSPYLEEKEEGALREATP